MKQFTHWMLESVGRFLPDDIEFKLHGISEKIFAAIPEVVKTQQPQEVGQLMSKRMNSASGKTQRFVRKFVVVYEPDTRSLAWDQEFSSAVFFNAAHYKHVKSADDVYNTLVHELIHSTDPNNDSLQGSEKGQKLDNDGDFNRYYGLRHEFDAFSGMITNWIVRRMSSVGEAKKFLDGLAKGVNEGLPRDLKVRVDRLLKLEPKLRNKFLRRVYQAVQEKMAGRQPRTSVPVNRGVHQQPGYTGEETPQAQQPAYVPKMTQ